MEYYELIKERFSVRSYKGCAIEDDKLKRILQAGRLSPTACNRQPQKVFVIRSKEGMDAIASTCRFTFGAPVVLVIGYDKDRAWKNKLMPPYTSGETDAAIVATHMMLAAHNEGLGSCWVGYFDAERVREALGLPENIVVTSMLTLGYISDNAEPLDMHSDYRDFDDTIQYM